MKIKQEIVNAVDEMVVVVFKHCFADERNFRDSPLNNMIRLRLGKIENIKCKEHNETIFDYCWNCETPLCFHCAYPVLFPNLHLIYNFCRECKNEFVKLGKNIHKRQVN